jgi:probable HAF family extracellular repeat protein
MRRATMRAASRSGWSWTPQQEFAMRSSVTRGYAVAVSIALVLPVSVTAQGYNLTILQGLGGGAAANSINDRGWVAGVANDAGGTVSHAALWLSEPTLLDLGTLGAPSLNSAIAWPVKSNNGVIVGISDTNEINPLGEAFSCWAFFAPGAPTGRICKGFRWEKGRMSPLPPFAGGYNSYAAAANGRGQIVGWAENGVFDPTCDPDFQLLQFHAVIWWPNGQMQDLPPLPGDSVSAATAINDKGQVVGISGECGVAIGGVSARHAVLWENGVPINIGDLGGHAWNTPTAINNAGVIVGFSLPLDQDGTRNYRAFVWTRDRGIRKLDELAGTVRSSAWGLNDDNQIVGSVRLTGASPFAAMWQTPEAPIQNLNDLVSSGSPLLTIAGDINNDGKIAGSTASGLGFLATPK